MYELYRLYFETLLYKIGTEEIKRLQQFKIIKSLIKALKSQDLFLEDGHAFF